MRLNEVLCYLARLLVEIQFPYNYSTSGELELIGPRGRNFFLWDILCPGSWTSLSLSFILTMESHVRRAWLESCGQKVTISFLVEFCWTDSPDLWVNPHCVSDSKPGTWTPFVLFSWMASLKGQTYVISWSFFSMIQTGYVLMMVM